MKLFELGFLDTFHTDMFGEKPIINLKRKRSKEFTLNPRVMTDIKIFPTDDSFTQLTRTVPMIEDTFHLIPRTTVNLNLYGLTKK
jgi:hypothetical protein